MVGRWRCHKRGAPYFSARHKPLASGGRTSEIVRFPQPDVSEKTSLQSTTATELTLGLASPEKAKTFSGFPSGIL